MPSRLFLQCFPFISVAWDVKQYELDVFVRVIIQPGPIQIGPEAIQIGPEAVMSCQQLSEVAIQVPMISRCSQSDVTDETMGPHTLPGCI